MSADFYENILQLRKLETPWGVNPGVRFFSIGNGQQIHLAKVSADIIVTNKITHLTFNVIAFDNYLKFLNELGINYFDFSGNISKLQIRPHGIRQVYLQDPDGNWIENNDARY